MNKMRMPEPIGKKIARLRQERGLTQQILAEKLAISRVAVSHIEAGLSLPGERTVVLLAGLFKCAPLQLVENTTYPSAKTDRLPYTVAWYTALEMELALMERDLMWLERVDDRALALQVKKEWQHRLGNIRPNEFDEKEKLSEAKRRLSEASSQEPPGTAGVLASRSK